MTKDEDRLAALEADVAILRAAFLGLLAANPMKPHLIAALRNEGKEAIEKLQQMGVTDVSLSHLMQARAKLLQLMENSKTTP